MNENTAVSVQVRMWCISGLPDFHAHEQTVSVCRPVAATAHRSKCACAAPGFSSVPHSQGVDASRARERGDARASTSPPPKSRDKLT